MINSTQIKANTTIVCSNNTHFAVVDYLEGADQIKLAKDAHGKHHYIPLSWVKSVDDKIHLDRSSDAAMRRLDRPAGSERSYYDK